MPDKVQARITDHSNARVSFEPGMTKTRKNRNTGKPETFSVTEVSETGVQVTDKVLGLQKKVPIPKV